MEWKISVGYERGETTVSYHTQAGKWRIRIDLDTDDGTWFWQIEAELPSGVRYGFGAACGTLSEAKREALAAINDRDTAHNA